MARYQPLMDDAATTTRPPFSTSTEMAATPITIATPSSPASPVPPAAASAVPMAEIKRPSGPEFNWKPLPGTGVKAVCGGPGKLVHLNASGKMYRWEASATAVSGYDWKELPGIAVDVAYSQDGELWHCNERQEIFCWYDGAWLRVAGKAIRISVARKDRILIRNKEGQLGKLPLVKSVWTQLPGKADQISIGADNEMWYTTKKGEIFRMVADKPVPVEGKALSITATSRDRTYHWNAKGEIYKWMGPNEKREPWIMVNGAAKSLSVAADGTAIMITRESKIMLHTPVTGQ